MDITRTGTYVPSQDIVYREVAEDAIIVPLVSGMGDSDDELYALNETGQAIWRLLDGTRDLAAVIDALAAEYRAEAGEIEADVLGLVGELVSRGMLVLVGAPA